MNKLIESIYYTLPPLFQNVPISTYGYWLFKRRYGGNYQDYLKDIIKTQFFSCSQIEQLQRKKMIQLLKHVFKNVPFYQQWSKKTGLTIKDFRSITDLQKLPVIDKEQIRNDPTLFCATNYLQRKNIFIIYTSGTTGKPLKIFCDPDSRQLHYAFWTRFQMWHKVSFGMRKATFCGRIIASPKQLKPPFWRYDKFQNNYLFSSYHMSEENLKYYYQKLLEIRPKQIVGYPSSLFILARYMKKNNLKGIKPICIFTTAETLLAHQRETIEDAFECKVADQYGCAEMCVFISQCEYGTYHVHPEYGILEALDQNGNPVPMGVAGEAVCTGFVNKTMPLVRYRLGDIVRLEQKDCPCGRHFPVVAEILGRVDDILITPDGRPLGRLDPVFKGIEGIRETQIVQTDRQSITLNLVIDEGFTEQTKKKLLYELRKRTGDQMKIHLNFLDSIPREANGKFRAVISRTNEENQ